METTVYNKNLTIYRNCNEDDIKKIEKENGIKCGKMGFYNPRLSGSKKSALIRFSILPTMVFEGTKGGYVKHPRLGAMEIYNKYIPEFFKSCGHYIVWEKETFYDVPDVVKALMKQRNCDVAIYLMLGWGYVANYDKSKNRYSLDMFKPYLY